MSRLMALVLSVLAGPAATCLALGAAPAHAAVSPLCLPSPLPTSPVGAVFSMDVIRVDDRMRLDLWRHPCQDSTDFVLLMRATPQSSHPTLCETHFTLAQDGLEWAVSLRQSLPATTGFCGEILAPLTVIPVPVTIHAVPFDPGRAFSVLFAGFLLGLGEEIYRLDVPVGGVPLTVALSAAVLPASRSVQVGVPATAFATLLTAGTGTAVGCRIAPLTSVPAAFTYQLTDPFTNFPVGGPNPTVDIAGGGGKTFLIVFSPSAPFPPTDIQLSFDCVNTSPAPVWPGLNTLLLSASTGAIPDIVALAATLGGDGIVSIPGTNGTGFFAVATANVGASGTITVSADTAGAALPVNLFLCQTNPASGECISPLGPTVTTRIDAGERPTFAVLAQGAGTVAFDPVTHRIVVRFKDAGGVIRGATSVAVRTQ